MGNMITKPTSNGPFPVVPGEPLIIAPAEHGPLLAAKGFPRRLWNPDLFALTVLAEFAATDWSRRIVLPPPPAPDSQATKDEIARLVTLAKERPARAQEIVKQDEELTDYWVQLLAISGRPGSPTFELLKIATRVAELTMSHFKRLYDRPRAQQLQPALMPMLPMPGHPSYPSGHMAIARLLSLVASEVLPDAKKPLLALAERVGQNREIAGLHYPSDTDAGRELADKAFAILKTCTGYVHAHEAALAELKETLGP